MRSRQRLHPIGPLGPGLLGHHPAGLALDPGQQPSSKTPAVVPTSRCRNTGASRSLSAPGSRGYSSYVPDDDATDLAIAIRLGEHPHRLPGH